jgi:hypothetical protein
MWLTEKDDKHLTFSHCPLPNDCHCITHLSCLARHFLTNEKVAEGQLPPVLPRDGQCPGCEYPLLWGQVVRACYTRRTNAQTGGTYTGSQASNASLSALSSEGGSDDGVTMSEEEDEVMEDTPKARRMGRTDTPATPVRASPKRARSNKSAAATVKKGTVKKPRTAVARGRGRGRGRGASRVSVHRAGAQNSSGDQESSESEGSRMDREMMEL